MSEKLSKEVFIERANKIHNCSYDYSLVDYKNNKTKVIIICPKHSSFLQAPDKHINAVRGCPTCAYENKADKWRSNNENFTKKANEIHDNKYNYELVNYKSAITKVKIICNLHGEFEQQPSAHLGGQGCPGCSTLFSERKLLENIKKEFRTINIIHQGNPSWLGRQRFDIYLPDYNIAIEYQGKQHFKPVDYFGGEKAHQYTKECDKRKKELATKNGCKLFYFTYKSSEITNNYPYKIFIDESDLFKEIKYLLV